MSRIKWTKRMSDRAVNLCKKLTYEEAASKLSKEFKLKITANAVRKAYERFTIEILPVKKITVPNGVKALLLDIETSYMEVKSWAIYKQFISPDSIIKDWAVLSWSAKWYGEPEKNILYMDNRKKRDPRDDKAILKKMWKLLDEADVVITQNGKKFDIKKLFARFAIHGMGKPSPFKHFDTFRVAKKIFGFTANSLDYLSSKLCKTHRKSKHSKFSGRTLWDECLAGNLEAWKEMEHYNKEDVLTLEELASVLMPWDSSNTFSVFVDKAVCNCGSSNLVKQNKFYYTNSSKFRLYKCADCGAQYRDKKNLLQNVLPHGL